MGSQLDSQTIQALQAMQEEFVERRGWLRFHTPRNIAQALSVESAELLRLFQWGCGETDEELAALLPALKDELADVQLFVFSLASALNLDLESAVIEKLRINGERWPDSATTSDVWVDRQR